MNLYGKKVMLRAMEPEDMEMLREMVNDPEIEHMIGGWSFPVSKQGQLQWYEKVVTDNQSLRLTIELLETGEAVGLIILNGINWKDREVTSAIKLKRDAPKRMGYASDAEFTLMQYVFEELHLHRISVEVMEYNTPSILMHEKCGAQREGLKRAAVYKNGAYHNVICYGILYRDFLDAAKKTGWRTE